MTKATVYKNVWIRWIHSTWENEDGWRTDVHQSVLDDDSISDALFVLDDQSCVFVPMEKLREVLAEAPTRFDGRVVGPFNVNSKSKTVNGVSVPMSIKRPKKLST